VQPDAEQHHRGPETVQCMEAFHTSTLREKLNGLK
jgi:hypothetical protein